MASVIRVDANTSRVQVRRKGFRPQCKTFKGPDSFKQAEAWGEAQEKAMLTGKVSSTGDVTIGDVLTAYRKMRDKAGRPVLDNTNEHYLLKSLTTHLSHLVLSRVTPDDLVKFAATRKGQGAGPYTINMDISKLGTVLRYGCAFLRVTAPDIVGSARPLLAHLRLIGGGGKRERLPTEDELVNVVRHVRDTRGLVYAEAILFAVASCMRRGEVVALRRSDVDAKTRCAKVMRKHPRAGKKLHNVPLMDNSWAILQRQPVVEGEDRYFPIHESTLSKYFTWACRDLSIIDLHFHDLRHEGATRLFEDGYPIPQVAMVTGHAKWEHLKRYTQLKPERMARRQTALPEITTKQEEDDEL